MLTTLSIGTMLTSCNTSAAKHSAATASRLDGAKVDAAPRTSVMPRSSPAPSFLGGRTVSPDSIATPRNTAPVSLAPASVAPAGASVVKTEAVKTDAVDSDAARTPRPASRPRKRPVFDGTGVLMSPKPLDGQTPAPTYPEAARLAGETGAVVVRVSIAEDGLPVEARVEESSGFERLDKAAVEAAMRWKFKAGTWQGKAVELDLLLPFRFGLKDPKKP